VCVSWHREVGHLEPEGAVEVARHGARGLRQVQGRDHAVRDLAQRDQLDVGLDQTPVAALEVVDQPGQDLDHRLRVLGHGAATDAGRQGHAADLVHAPQQLAQCGVLAFGHAIRSRDAPGEGESPSR
jgi:hypothetical protein